MTASLECAREPLRDVQPVRYRTASLRDDDTLCSNQEIIGEIASLAQDALTADTINEFLDKTKKSLELYHHLLEAWRLSRARPPADSDLILLDHVERFAGPAKRHLLEQAMNMFDGCASIASRFTQAVAPENSAVDRELARSFNSWLVVGSWLVTCIAQGTRRPARNPDVYDHLFHAAISVAGESAADAAHAYRLRFGDPDDEP